MKHLPSSSQAATTQNGLTLIELMVAMTLGFGVVLSCFGLLLATRQGSQYIDEGARLQDGSRLALEYMTRIIRQTNHGTAQQRITGRDNARYAGQHDLIQDNGSNNSDLISITLTGTADGTIRNCGGGAIDASTSSVSSFYAIFGSSGEPELICRYDRGTISPPADALVQGIEALHFLYAVDTDGDDIPNQMLSATDMAPEQWSRVVAVRIALLARNRETDNIGSNEAVTYHLFGPTYSSLRGSRDPGVMFTPTADNRGRHRRLFNTTVWLRQPPP